MSGCLIDRAEDRVFAAVKDFLPLGQPLRCHAAGMDLPEVLKVFAGPGQHGVRVQGKAPGDDAVQPQGPLLIPVSVPGS